VVDQALESVLGWAFHERFGYLTACPTNVGTGMRISVMLHLPALAESGEMKAALRGLSKLNITVRGLHGEGSEPSGHFFQISNLRALGMTEQELADLLAETVDHLVGYERATREALLTQTRWKIEDRVFRAWGLLTLARSLTSEELITNLSWVRLGLAVGLLGGVAWTTLDRLFVDGQPAHLQLRHGVSDAAERDRLRADLVRQALAPRHDERN
jgi:protein arginine kinase